MYRGMRKYKSVKLRKMPQTCGVYGGIPWLDITHAYRVENPDDFISLGRVCEIFLNNWMNTL